MKCPSCNANIKGNESHCSSCGYFAPGAKYFIDGGSFLEWEKQIKQKDSEQDEPLPVNSTAAENTADIVPEARIEPAPTAFKPVAPEVKPVKTAAPAAAPVATPAAKSHSKILSGPLFSREKGVTSSSFTTLAALVLFTRWLLRFLLSWDAYIEGEVILNSSSYLVILSVWVVILIALRFRRRSKILMIGLILLTFSRFLLVIASLLYYSNSADTPNSFLHFIYVFEVFIPAFLLTIAYLKRLQRVWYFPGICSFICLIVNFYYFTKFDFEIIRSLDLEYFIPVAAYVFYVLFFFAAGRYIYHLNTSKQ